MPTALLVFDNTLGALLVGGLVATALWGVTCVQTFKFFTRRTIRQDTLFLKLTVTVLWLLDTFNSTLDGHILYHLLVTNHLNPIAVTKPIWSLILHIIITTISDFLIRTMFVHRIYRLSNGNLLITAWIMSVSTINLVTGIWGQAETFKIISYQEIKNTLALFWVGFATGTTSDFSIVFILSWQLAKSKTGFRRADTVLNTLMLYTLSTGLLVGIYAICCMITYVAMPKNLISLGFNLPLCKLYYNSYLAMLNARVDLIEIVTGPASHHLSNISESEGRSSNTSTIQYPLSANLDNFSPAMEISVNTYIERSKDGTYTPLASPTISPLVLMPGITDPLYNVGALVEHGSGK